MAELYDSSNVLITNRVTSVVPDYEITEVENALLGGGYEVQVIGQPRRVCFTAFTVTSIAAKNAVDVAKAIKEPLKVTSSGVYYVGTIRGTPAWNRLTPTIYQTNIVLLVSAEGAI